MKPIVYTLGEPAGIGADIIIQLAQKQVFANLVCLGDMQLLQERAQTLELPLRLRPYPELPSKLGEICVLHHPIEDHAVGGKPLATGEPLASGTPLVANAQAVLSMLDTAIDGCLSGEFSAMVTGPVHKGIINEAGIAFSGHTEYLAELTGAVLPVMLLASNDMRVALVTTHLPLKDVSAAITNQLVQQICTIVDNDLKSKFGISNPRILVCGLNPHAGEGGHLGREEIDVIIPALNALREKGINVIGPLPADTLFTEKYLNQADVAVAMYHDQGLPVLKSRSFGKAANITLGLPIIRTSVDHGTACDLAGTGKADIGSLETAIRVACEMAEQQIGAAPTSATTAKTKQSVENSEGLDH